MRFLPTADQREMAQTVRDALAKHCSAEVLRGSREDDQLHRIWSALADLGVFALTVDEQAGGLGLDERDAVGVLVELGRAAVPGPIAETFAAGRLLATLPGSDRIAEMLGRIAAGESMVAVGLGEQPLVESADRADILIVQCGAELHAISADKAELVHQPSVDVHRRLFKVKWHPERATLLVATEQSAEPLALVRDHLLFASSCQLIGLSKQMLEMTVRHVAVREQFGRPLGTMQAVQHRLADVALGIEFAEPVVARAACSLAGRSPSIVRDVAMAKVFASEAAERAAYSGLQLHGAIGYTQEHDFHLYAQRAWALALAFGDARRHRARVADELLGARPAARYPVS